MKPEHYLVIALLGVIAVSLSIIIRNHFKTTGRVRREILKLLSAKWVRGRDIRQTLAQNGMRISKASFYSIMWELMEEKKAICRYTTEQNDGVRWFRLPLTKAEIEAHARDFAKMLPELLERYPGEFVAILDRQVVAHTANERELIQGISQRNDERFVFLGYVPPREEKPPSSILICL